MTYCLEHIQGRNSNPLRPPIDPAVLRALVAPFCAGAGIQQDANQEQVHHTLAFLRVIDILGPGRHKVGDPVPAADSEVLIPTMRGDAREGRIVVSLRGGWSRLASCGAQNDCLPATCLDDIRHE